MSRPPVAPQRPAEELQIHAVHQQTVTSPETGSTSSTLRSWMHISGAAAGMDPIIRQQEVSLEQERGRLRGEALRLDEMGRHEQQARIAYTEAVDATLRQRLEQRVESCRDEFVEVAGRLHREQESEIVSAQSLHRRAGEWAERVADEEDKARRLAQQRLERLGQVEHEAEVQQMNFQQRYLSLEQILEEQQRTQSGQGNAPNAAIQRQMAELAQQCQHLETREQAASSSAN
ncbi:MAG: hypothetical protein ABGY29_09580, partial [bacterium]